MFNILGLVQKKEGYDYKKIGAVFVSLALALCLTACNNGGTSDGEASAPSFIQSGAGASSSTTASSDVSSTSASSTAAGSTSTSASTTSTSTGSSETSSSSEESLISESVSESSPESAESVPESSALTESSAPAESGESEQGNSEPTALESAAPAQSESESQTEPVSEEEKTLVVYFTWSSNTAGMAETIADLTGADTFEIVPVVPYPEEYTPCTEVALEERDNNARPAIQNLPDSVSEYDNILIGYPIWWHTAPMIIGTFPENYDLTGIDVYPFTQSASMNEEQFEQSMDFVRGCAGSAAVHDGLFARPSDTDAITSYRAYSGFAQNGQAKGKRRRGGYRSVGRYACRN